MKRTFVITLAVVFIAITGLVVFIRLTSAKMNEEEFAEVRQGLFEITVNATGELVAENSIDIKGPNIVQNRNFRAATLKITDLVPEGTEVRQGDFIAELDRSGFTNTFRDEQEVLKTKETEFQMKLLDTAMTLSALRDEIKNDQFTAEEAAITVNQSKYEPPATQRQAEISLEKARRNVEQKKKFYKLKTSQSRAEIRNLKIVVDNQQRKVDDLKKILDAFTIKAPAAGMVIYKKDRMGNKITSGTNLNPFDPVVATLPDLSSMLSKIYVSEIEINKVKTGQPVEVSIDAFQGKIFRGRVAAIANIGEQLPNSDTKVFEVMVRLDDFDPTLRPSMTTGNRILINSYDNVIYVPTESVHAGMDSLPFVYTRKETRNFVILGESNDKNVIIEKGLKPGTSVWLTTPPESKKFRIEGTELIPEIRKSVKLKVHKVESP
jgi:RND family efflux transporter MFP subunit